MKFLVVIITFSFGLCFNVEAFASEVKLKMATLNLGLLDLESINVYVPFFKERSAALPAQIRKYLNQERPDVVALQELWTKQSFAELQKAVSDVEIAEAPKLSEKYVLISHIVPKKKNYFLDHKTGLAFLVKARAFSKYSVDFIRFRDSTNTFPRTSETLAVCAAGVICQRGLLKLTLEMTDQRSRQAKQILVFTTHLTPILENVAYRKTQINEMTEILGRQTTAQSSAIFVLGDFNVSKIVGPMKSGDDGSLRQWNENGALYDLFFEQAKANGLACVDSGAQLRGRSSDGKENYYYTQDRELNELTKLSNSTKREPSQILDFIFFCPTLKNEVSVGQVVEDTKLIFTEHGVAVKLSNGRVLSVPLSDHFGVQSQFFINWPI